MKEKDASVNYKEHQLILYVEKKDGSYGPVKTGSYITKNYIDDFWYKRKKLEQDYMGKVRKGEISPIAYYMVLEELTPSELASRVRMSTRKVKKHLTTRHFGAITLEQLQRYCEVFNVSLVNLLQVIVTDKKNLKVIEEKTDNPFFTILKISAGKK
ncbi:MAG TPA: hypothetical protein PKN50_16460 [Spirochaetota bacterium]|nr:hypothetical protein [Spirochaetota bacterium]HPV41204.1 hypothetical protein [Spirochaetota bacterium]